MARVSSESERLSMEKAPPMAACKSSRRFDWLLEPDKRILSGVSSTPAGKLIKETG